MANKTRTWTEKELQEYGLVDCRERPLPLKETVAVKCHNCPKTGFLKFSVLRSKMITYGLRWRCGECIRVENSNRGKTLTGKRNPFYGKQHTENTKEIIKIANKKKWERHRPEEIRDIMCNVRKASYAKYGGNPMNSPEVREAHLRAIEKFFSDPERVDERNRKIIATNQLRYGADLYVQSDEYASTATRFTSKMEKEIKEIFETNGFAVRKTRKDHVEVDVVVPELKLGIEANGCYWHSEIYKDRRYHLAKTEYCAHNGIRLIHIFDHEWESKKQQILGYLRSIMGKNEVVYARNCTIKEIDKKTASKFLDMYHIQGKSNGSSLFVALEHNKDILAVAAFGIHHRNNKDWVLKRFAGKSGVSVAGGLSRISSYAYKKIGESIVTWCDRRWSDGGGYVRAGWVATEVLPPDYFYIKNGRFYCSKQARRKSAVSTPTGMTEREHATQDRLSRVYDCGKIKFVFGGN